MAVGQGYAFSGVILILAALLTWGVLELAQRADDDNGDSSSNSTPDADSDIQVHVGRDDCCRLVVFVMIVVDCDRCCRWYVVL